MKFPFSTEKGSAAYLAGRGAWVVRRSWWTQLNVTLFGMNRKFGIGKTVNKVKILPAVHPNVGIEMEYKRLLRRLILEMHDSVIYWLSASYKANEPEIAQDATPSNELKRSIRKLSKRWQRRFDLVGPKLARHFAEAVGKRSDASLKRILGEAGMAVNFKLTAIQRDVLQATVQQNVALIKSIPQKYFGGVESAVMRSVQTGRDLERLTKELQANYSISFRRAAFIALDQNNKATSALTRARKVELGIEKEIWLHSGAGHHPRPKHVAASGKRFDIKKGLPIGDKGQYVFPGEEIHCRCVSRPVIAGFS